MSTFKSIEMYVLLSALVVTGAQVTFASGGNTGDFNDDGSVDLHDFVAFVSMFGTSSGEAGYDARGDFDDNGSINLSDFAAFVERFGNEAPSSGGGGPDPGRWTGNRGIIRSFEVSHTSLTAGQAFTMETNLRNPGWAVSLGYYRSLDATIDSSDALIYNEWLFHTRPGWANQQTQRQCSIGRPRRMLARTTTGPARTTEGTAPSVSA